MDLQTLTNLFASTLSADPNARKSSELEIRKVCNQEGFCSALLQIIAEKGVDVNTRQACSVFLKNRVYRYYADVTPAEGSDATNFIPQSDKDTIKANILALLSNSDSRSITAQLAAALKTIIQTDYPERWPNLLDEVKVLLRSNNVQEIHAGCIAALEAVRAFRSEFIGHYRHVDIDLYLRSFRSRNPNLIKVIVETFPILVQIASHVLSQPPTTSVEAPTILHLILKTYRSSIIVDLSAHQQQKESIVPWGQLLFAVVNIHVPDAAVPADEDEKEKSEWWKAKKWAYAILGRLFHRYGNPSQLPSALQDDYGPFAQHFVTSFAPEILSTYLKQIGLFVEGKQWMSKKCQYHAFSFFTECIKPKATWALLKPNFENLVTKYVFPQLSFNQHKQALWESDPIDYLRVTVDEYEAGSSPVASATTFLLSLASNRTKVAFMPILALVNSVLRSSAAAPQRFGALNMVAALGPWMMRHPDVKNNVENFLVQFVTPEFNSSEPYLKAIACEVVGTMTKSGLEYTNKDHLRANFQGVAQCLDDPQLPVRANAALALTEMVMHYDDVRNAVAPQVGKVVQDLLKLSDETDLDILNNSMEVFVDAFQTELLPVAAQLTQRLCDSYMRIATENLVHEGNADPENGIELENEDDEKAFAAMGIAKTISTIVSSIENAPEILVQVQEIIIPMIQYTLDNKILDLFDNVFELLDSLTFRLRAINPKLWPLFESTCKLFQSDAVDFLEEMLPSLDNFLSFGSDVIKSRPDYKKMLAEMYITAMTHTSLGESDRINGSKLAESMLLNLRGSIDEFLEPIVSTSLNQLEARAVTSLLRLSNFEVLVNAILYNPRAALHIMETVRPGSTRNVFDKWFESINTGANATPKADAKGKPSVDKLPRVHDKRLSIMALCALMELPPSDIPETLQPAWAHLVGGALKMFADLPKAIADRKAAEQALGDEDEDDEDFNEKFLNMNDEEEDVWDEDSAYLEMLANEGARLREKSDEQKLAEFQEVESDEDDDLDDDIAEELGYISPLDAVNPYVSFKQALTAFQHNNAQGYQAATTSLSVEQQTQLMEIMRQAENPSPPPAA